MITTNVGMEWGVDVRVNNIGDLEFMLMAVKLDDDGETVLFSKKISGTVLQNIVSQADSLDAQQKTMVVNGLNNFRDNLAGTL